MSVAHVMPPVPLVPGSPEYALSSKPMATNCGTSDGVNAHGGLADGATLSLPVHAPRPSSQTAPLVPASLLHVVQLLPPASPWLLLLLSSGLSSIPARLQLATSTKGM